MNRNLIKLLGLCVIVFLAGGCSLASKYTRPAAPVPAAWPAGEAYTETKGTESASTVQNVKWQDFLTDTRLQKIVEIALNNNRDLRVAAFNVERARALYNIQRAELLPSVTATGSGFLERLPADLSQTGSAHTSEKYNASVGVISWEIDFFGRIRGLKDRALEEYMATDQARRSAQILLVSSVANTYLTLAADRENLKLAASTLETQETSYQLILKRYTVGLVSELDLQQGKSQVEAARRDIALFTQYIAQDQNALNLLVGATIPQELLPSDLADVRPPQKISAGLSSDLLLQRPDVLAAEHQLKAANANIGAARAAFLPQIALTSTIGTESADLGNLFKSEQGTWSFVPQISIPIFDARTWSAYRVTKVDRDIAVAQYEKAIQSAFREVADALAVRGTISRQLEAQHALVDAIAETYRLADARYQKGIDSYLSVLVAQRSLIAAKTGLIYLQLNEFVNRTTIYKVLGGGV